MACSHPEDDDQQNQQTEDPTLEEIDNVLALGRENAQAYLSNVIDKVRTLNDKASETLESCVSIPGVGISTDEKDTIVNFLSEALVNISHSCREVGYALNLADQHSRMALENFTHDDLQNMINADQQHILWRRVALHRANFFNLHVEQQLVSQAQQSLGNQAATAALNLEISIDYWRGASQRLLARVDEAIKCIVKATSLLPAIYDQVQNVSDSSCRELRSIGTAVCDIVRDINNTFLVKFQQAINTLETIRKSAADERTQSSTV